MTNNEQYYINAISLSTKAKGAFLAAAVGDALGWPQEPEARRIDKKVSFPAEILNNEFQKWIRKSGGQYYPHQEVILAGEYSDDTQLILCTARSLFYGTSWWDHLTRIELPTWTFYERGGGGATKRAANKWLIGLEPWSFKNKDQAKYFEAGGNGVAMRILPHCLLSPTESNFTKIAKNIIANGVTTHGHPRALVGALAYGFAVWVALRQVNTLEYGAIIDKVLSEANTWSILPDLNDICPTWENSALQITHGKYGESWQNTVNEMLGLLDSCREGMKQGALSIEQQILTKIGCFDRNVKGAGTVTAAAAIFLASRFAANPFYGLLEAGFALGADTDTLASMTGGILGAIAGVEWLGNHATKVQDAIYIQNLAEDLVIKKSDIPVKEIDNIATKKTHLDSLLKKIEASKIGDTIFFPSERQAQISNPIIHESLSESTIVKSWKLNINDGQSLYIKKISRTKSSDKINPHLEYLNKFAGNIQLEPVNIVDLKTEILVSDIEKSRFFYEKVLGVKVEKESTSSVTYKSIFLRKNGHLPEPNETYIPNTIYLDVESLNAAYNNVIRVGAVIVKDISQQKDGRNYFYCLDPDKNIVKIYHVKF